MLDKATLTLGDNRKVDLSRTMIFLTSHLKPSSKPKWLKYVTPAAVVLLAAALLVTITRNWNAREGGQIDQVTDDAYVRGDLTPLSGTVAGIVRGVKVSDFQQVRKGDLLVALEDNDYLAHVAQASAAVEAAEAAIENNRRQSELQDARIARAHVVRTRKEHDKQEALLLTSSSTPQKVEQVDADEQRFAAQLASREADLEQAKTVLRSNELAVEAEMRSKAVLESQPASTDR